MDSNKILDPIMQGLGLEPKPDPKRIAALQDAIENEQDPYMKALLMTATPIDSMPGFYKVGDEKMLLKYNPTTDVKPQFLDMDLISNKAKVLIQPQLLEEDARKATILSEGLK